METFIFLTLLTLLLAAVAPGLYLLGKRVAARPAHLEIWRVMHRLGLSPGEVEGEEARGMALALRRCTLCPGVDACQEWLASSSRAGLENFCPNASYFKTLERR
ncbi:MAG TPA: DUF6455 family protein [Burkholderiales bacterium]|nr:DUF6455 family protein [Burkholderiales bacterium]